MILVLTDSDDATADYFCKKLDEGAVRFLRFNTDRSLTGVQFRADATGPVLIVEGATYRPGDFTAIWLRRPGPMMPLPAADQGETQHIASEWAEAFEGFAAHIPLQRWINHPSANAGASHKLEQLTRAKKFGLTTPDTILTQSRDELRAFWQKCDGQVLAKPLSCGYIERDKPEDDTQVFTSAVTEADLDSEDIGHCPTLFQQIVKKAYDFRVIVFDDHVTSMMLQATDGGKPRLDIRRNNMIDVKYTPVQPPAHVKEGLLNLLRSYGLRYAAVDFVADRTTGQWVFLEINPNGQWAWLDLVGGANIAADFMAILNGKSPLPVQAPRRGCFEVVADCVKYGDNVLTWLLLKLFGRDATFKEVRAGGYQEPFDESQFECQEDESLDLVLEQAEKMYNQERERRDSVSDKCKTFLQISALLLPLTGIASRAGGRMYILPAVFLLISSYLLIHILDIREWRSVRVAPRNVRQKKSVLQRRLVCDYLYAAHDNKQTSRYLVDILKSARASLVIGLALFPILFLLDPVTKINTPSAASQNSAADADREQ